MPDSSTPHYTAFLSYAHKDEAWANWLHTKLEQFKIDTDLVGSEAPRGPVPKTLRPIFLDRGNFAGGNSLAEATLMALDGSAALIVLCSTTSAQRPIVNEEVRLFKERHPDRPIIPVLIDGTPPANFPKALRYELNRDGTLSDREVTVLGPDLRDEADGKQLGLAKVVAGLLGLSDADDIYRRAERHRIKQQRIQRGLGAAAVVFVTVGGYFGWAYLKHELILAKAYEAIEKYNDVAGSSSVGPERLKELIVQIAEGAADDPRKARVIRLLNENQPDEAANVLKQIADDAEKRIKNQMKGVADAYQQYGTIAGLGDPERARKAYSQALSYDAENRESLYGRGWLNLLASSLTEATQDLEKLLDLSPDADHAHHRYLAHVRLGEVAKARGELTRARTHQNKALEIAKEKLAADSTSSEWQRFRSFSLEKLGDLLVEQREISKAEENYARSLDIRRKLHTENPDDKARRRELAVALEKVGDIARRKRDFDTAAQNYEEAFALRSALMKAEPTKLGWQRGVALSHERLGRLYSSRANPEKALENYQKALDLREALVKAHPNNATWQRDLSVSFEHLGTEHAKSFDIDAALKAHRAALSIRDDLRKHDPDNAVWTRDLAVSQSHIGHILCFLGDLDDGLPHLRSARKLYEDLTQADGEQSASPRAQIELARHYMMMSSYVADSGNRDEALVLMKKAKSRVAPVARNIDRKDWQHFLTSINEQLADLEQ